MSCLHQRSRQFALSSSPLHCLIEMVRDSKLPLYGKRVEGEKYFLNPWGKNFRFLYYINIQIWKSRHTSTMNTLAAGT